MYNYFKSLFTNDHFSLFSSELTIRPSLQSVLIPPHVSKSQGPSSSSSLSSAAQGGAHNSSSSGSASKQSVSEPSSSHAINN